MVDAAELAELSLLRQVQSIAKLGSWEWDVATGAIRWSDQLYRIYGFEPGTVKSSLELFLELVHPDDRERMGADAQKVLQDGLPRSTEYRIVRRDGSVRWIESSFEPNKDASGRYVRLVGVEKDVTDRRLAEAARIKAQERASQLASIVESSNDAIFSVSLDGKILTWNAAAERLYGWPAAEAIGAPLATVVREAGPGGLSACIERARRGEACPEVEARQRRRDGSELHVTITISRLHDGGGAAVGAAVIARDVSERTRAAEALRRSEERFKRLVESNLFSIVIGDGTGKIIDASDTFLALLGFDRDDIKAGKLRWDTLTPPEYAEIDAKVVESVRTTGYCAPYEKEFLRKDGTRVPILMGITMTAAPGAHDVEGIGFVLDLTRLKQAEDAVRRTEDQLRQAQKMEAIGRLAGGIAHDFNNILAAIMGYSEVGLRKAEIHEPVRPTFLEILSAADRAASLTRQLLAFGRKQVLQPRALDVNAIVAEMDRMLRRLLGDDVQLEAKLEKQLWAVKADPSQLEQVIVNLAVNARDAMPDGGSLTIETGNILIETRRPENPEAEPGAWVLLAVSDQGVGMDSATLARAFEPFFTTKAVGKGTGLGLSTVYGIVKQSGGHICASSQVGRGTRIEILLPRSDGEVEETPRAPTVVAPAGQETLLLVEDNDTVRRLVRELLEASGYKVLAARQGDEALALATGYPGPIDVLLTDVIMPGMNGPQLHARLVAQRPKLPVLYMSGHTDGILQKQGALEPECDFIQKPFTLAALSQALRKVLGSRVD